LPGETESALHRRQHARGAASEHARHKFSCALEKAFFVIHAGALERGTYSSSRSFATSQGSVWPEPRHDPLEVKLIENLRPREVFNGHGRRSRDTRAKDDARSAPANRGSA